MELCKPMKLLYTWSRAALIIRFPKWTSGDFGFPTCRQRASSLVIPAFLTPDNLSLRLTGFK